MKIQSGYQILSKLLYSVSNTLVGCSSSNNATSAGWGSSYTATLTADNSHTLNNATIKITMGGTDITDSVYDSGVITISKVTGNIVITATALSIVSSKILGVSWTNNNTSTMTRTDDAVNMGYSINSTTGEITSDFSSEFPYSQMTRETDASGNVFVNVPSMWFRITTENIGNTTGKITGIAVSSTGGDGWYQTKAFKYGAYGASTDGTVLKSVSRATRAGNLTRATARTQAMAVGTGYHQRDLYQENVLMFLWWIEFANKNSQAIMDGYKSSSGFAQTGGTDNLGFSTGYNPDGNQMIWHGIEDFIGNMYEWEDGIVGVLDSKVQYVSDDYTKYNDTGIGMNTLGYDFYTPKEPVLSQYPCIFAFAWDVENPFLVYAVYGENPSMNAYNKGFCDGGSRYNNACSYRGSYAWENSQTYGITFFQKANNYDNQSFIGCRLCKEV